MPTELETKAVEKGTYVISASFTDEDGAAVTPNVGLKWTLTDGRGTVINERQDVPLTPATSVDILLQGDDLTLAEGEGNERAVTIEGTYNSSLGSNLPLSDEVRFRIASLTHVT